MYIVFIGPKHLSLFCHLMVLLLTQLDRFLLHVNKMRKNSLQRERQQREKLTAPKNGGCVKYVTQVSQG